MKELFDKIVTYFQDNPIYFYIAVAVAVLIVAVIIIMIVLGVKRSKAKKQAAKEEASALPSAPSRTQSAEKAETTASPKSEISAVSQQQAATPIYDFTSEDKTETHTPEATEQPVSRIPDTDRQENEVSPAGLAAATENAEKEKMPDNALSSAQKSALSQKSEPREAGREQGRAAANAEPRSKGSESSSRRTEKAPSAARRSTPVAEKQNAAPAERPAPVPAATKPNETDEEKRTAYAGKWIVSKNEETGAYSFELRASNGEKLLGSIEYTSLNGAKNGIKTHKNNIAKGNIVISQNKKGQFYFRLLNGSKQLLCTGETYPTKAGCESAVESVKRFAETAVITVKDEQEEE